MSSNHFTYSRFYADHRRRVIIGVFMAMMLIMLVGIPGWYASTSMSLQWLYNPWGVPEWLINYEGGFVRRGLPGEVILSVSRASGISAILLVYILSYALYFAVLGIMLLCFRRKRWAWWIVFALPLCGYVQSIVRKDFFMYLLIIGIFALLGSLKVNNRDGRGATAPNLSTRSNSSDSNLWKIGGVYLLTAIGMLSHEGFAFFGVAAACLYLWRVAGMKGAGVGLAVLTMILFGIAALAKGNAMTADAIEASLTRLPSFPPLPDEGAIDALRWEADSTFLNHLQINFRAPYRLLEDRSGLDYIVGVGVWILRVAIIYYTMTNLPAVFSRHHAESTRIATRDSLGSLIILSWITMLPMFTILCCDRSRTTQFWIMGAYIPAMMMSLQTAERMIPKPLARFTRSLNNRLERIVAPRGGWLIFLMLLLLSGEVVTVVRKLL